MARELLLWFCGHGLAFGMAWFASSRQEHVLYLSAVLSGVAFRSNVMVDKLLENMSMCSAVCVAPVEPFLGCPF